MSDSRTRGDEPAARRADATLQPSASEVRVELERILASRCFQQAGRASHFLRFVVDQTLAGSGQRLKGYTIGVEVFGRPADFDAQSDALVRVEAGRLRRRLVEYYASEGLTDPVRIELPRGSYAVECHLVEAAAPAPLALPAPAHEPRALPWRHIAAALAVLLFVAGGVIAWQQLRLAAADRAFDLLGEEPQRTELPRLVVVPFENLSSDGALDMLAASMTEEIMLRLDELDVFVIASQARWYGASREKRVDSAAGGGYLFTGSVRGSMAEARVAVRLIETGTGMQLWTASYDKSLAPDQVQELQEQVARDVTAIAAPYGAIFEAELARARRSVHEPKLRDCLATYYDYRRGKEQGVLEDALQCFEAVAARQPDVAQVWSGLAMLHLDDYAAMFGRGGNEQLESARAAVAKALALDRDDFLANLALTRVQFFDGDPTFRRGIHRALELRPSSAQALAQGGFLLTIRGDSASGLPLVERALQAGTAPAGLCNLAYAVSYLREQRFAEALTFALRVDARNWVMAQAVIAAAASHAGRREVAADAVRRILELYPRFEAEALANFERWHFDREYRDVLISGLRAAGLELREAAPSSLSGG
jgi:adenylate cyclase